MNAIFHALSDPSRRTILGLLRNGDMTVTEISRHVKVSGPTLSHHLDKLRRAKMIQSQRRGKFIHYSLNPATLDTILAQLKTIFPHF